MNLVVENFHKGKSIDFLVRCFQFVCNGPFISFEGNIEIDGKTFNFSVNTNEKDGLSMDDVQVFDGPLDYSEDFRFIALPKDDVAEKLSLIKNKITKDFISAVVEECVKIDNSNIDEDIERCHQDIEEIKNDLARLKKQKKENTVGNLEKFMLGIYSKIKE